MTGALKVWYRSYVNGRIKLAQQNVESCDLSTISFTGTVHGEIICCRTFFEKPPSDALTILDSDNQVFLCQNCKCIEVYP